MTPRRRWLYSLDDSDSDESRKYDRSSDGETDTDDSVETNLLFGGKEEEEGVLASAAARRSSNKEEEGVAAAAVAARRRRRAC